MTFETRRSTAPRLVVKILGFSFGVIATVLAAVFLLLSWQTRERLSRAIVENLEASQLHFADREASRRIEQRLQARTLAENPTLKAAVDTYHAERSIGGPVNQLLSTVQLELVKLQQTAPVPVLVVTDEQGSILASAGAHAADWSSGQQLALGVMPTIEPLETIVTRDSVVYLATVVPLALGADVIGDLILASPIDDEYARQLAREARTDVAILMNGRVIAASVPPGLRHELERATLPDDGPLRIAGDEFVVRRLFAVQSAGVYALGSVSAPVRAATAEAGAVLVAIGLGALLLGGGASWWLARTLADPIDQLRTTLAQMADARDFERPVPPSGSSFELDALTGTFDALRAAVSEAEAESEATYLGVIGALATALDARDPYTAGHSERVANLSVAIGRAMNMPERDLEVLRLGALLHDIGKIGVSDAVLRKPGTLTPDEFEQIKQHPTLGARILKPLHFLAEHLPIVELHHEQPDGRGYPYGLKGHDIPIFARIVHVADAFDAMTTARAYRPGRPATEAMAELWLEAGTSFDLEIVQVMASMPAAVLMRPPAAIDASAESAARGGSLVPFRGRGRAAERFAAS